MTRRNSIALAATLLVLSLAVLCPGTAHAQGCSQCLDTTTSTSPATQRAFAHAIELMIGAAAAFVTATVLIIRRHP